MSKRLTFSTELIDRARASLSESKRRTAVIEIRPSAATKLRRIPAGTVVAITTQSPLLLREIARAARARNYTRIDGLIGHLADATFAWGLKQRKHRLHESEVYSVADFYYRDHRIAGDQFLAADLPAMMTVMPFSGGKLEPHAFRAHIYNRHAARMPQTVVLIHQPVLSKLEQQILAQVPETENGLSLGGAINEAAIVAATAAVLLGGAVFYGLYLIYQKMVADRKAQQQQDQQAAGVDATADDAAVQDNADIQAADQQDAAAQDDAYVIAAADDQQIADQQIADQNAQDNAAQVQGDAQIADAQQADDAAAADAGAEDVAAAEGGIFGVNASQVINEVSATLREIQPAMAAEALLEMRTAMIAAGTLAA